MNKEIRRLFREKFPGAVFIIELSDFTTWKIGGAAVSVTASSPGMLADVIGVAGEAGVPWFILGRGSNVLAPDGECGSLLIRLGGSMAGRSWECVPEGWLLSCGAAARLPSLAGASCSRGAAGLEFAVGIPGSVGGAVFMNAGAYGSAFSDLVDSVEVLDSMGARRIFSVENCGFGYRSSKFMDGDVVIVEAKLRLSRGDPMELRRRAAEILDERRRKFPLEYPNAGSVFEKPDGGVPPGRLIEEAGLKGRTVGGAMVSRKHANFIVNMGGARSSHVRELVEIVKEKVLEHGGVMLREEIRYIDGKRIRHDV